MKRDVFRPFKQPVLIWHDEKNESWTYCGHFKILHYAVNKQNKPLFTLYRIMPITQQDSVACHYIAPFTSMESAKIIAAVIRINEYHYE